MKIIINTLSGEHEFTVRSVGKPTPVMLVRTPEMPSQEEEGMYYLNEVTLFHLYLRFNQKENRVEQFVPTWGKWDVFFGEEEITQVDIID